MRARHDPHRADQDRPFVARTIRRFAVPVILGWVVITALLSLAVPSLEQVAKERAVSLSVRDAPSIMARDHIGEVFQESNTDSVAMVLLEGDEPLGEDARRYYQDLIREFEAETTYVKRVQDFWGDPMTAQAVQSADGKAAYVQLSLAGNQGEMLANKSVDAVREIVDRTPAPAGVNAHITGPTPLSADMTHTGDTTAIKITVVTVIVISIMLLLAYRSISTVILSCRWWGSVWRRSGVHWHYWAISVLSVFRPLLSPSSWPSPSPREPTMGYSSSGAITKLARPAKIGRRPTTPHTAGWLT